MILYDNPISSNALKVRFALAELGLSYERRTIPLTLPRPASYEAINPLGLIPALEDGDLVLTESHAILRYLARREGRDDLYPAQPAPVDEFLDRFATRFRPALFRHEAVALGYGDGTFDAVPRDPEAAKRMEEEIAPDVRILDGLVDADGAVLGRFTIADCALSPILFRTTHTGLSLEPYPRLAALRERLLARPAMAAAEPVL